MANHRLPKALGYWITPVKDALLAISPEIAEGFFGSKKADAMLPAGQALRILSDSDRMTVWRAAFPSIAEEVELAWHHLDPLVMARRDCAAEGYDGRFTFALTTDEADLGIMIWLRKLMQMSGPYPTVCLDDLLANQRSLRFEKFDRYSAHEIDSSTIAYLASVILDKQPQSELAARLSNLAEEQLLGIRTEGSDHAIFTAVFCSNRPDLWQRILQHLPKAGKEPGFLERICIVPVGARPDAVLQYLKTIRDHDLLRFESVSDQIRKYFGIEWQWKSHYRDDLRPWFEDWIALLESAQGGLKGLPEAPGECLLALWAEALHDGDSALARIADPASIGPDAKLAAAHFLGLIPADKSHPIIHRYLFDSDPRVINIACGMFSGHEHTLPPMAERPDMFSRLRDLMPALQRISQLPPCPAPLPSPPTDFSSIHLALANLFPDGSEQEIEALLPHFTTNAREAVVRRLNRYRITEHERSLEKIIFGSDPSQWQRWLEDHDGTETTAQRRLLLKMIGDRSTEVVEAAGKAVDGMQLTAEEAELVRPVLQGKSAVKRLMITRLLAGQSDELLRTFLSALLASKSSGERIAALEVLRQLTERENTKDLACEILRTTSYRPVSAEESRAFDVLEKTLRPPPTETPPGLWNAFGLVHPRSLAQPAEPHEREVIIHSPVTLLLIESLDAWIQQRSDVMVRAFGFNNVEYVKLGEGKLDTPRITAKTSREELLTRFPLTTELSDWWNLRPAEHRDTDGFEGLRLGFAIEHLLESNDPGHNVMRTQLFGCDHAPPRKSSKRLMDQVFSWLIFINPGVIPTQGRLDYLIDSTETLAVRLPDTQKNWACVWGKRLSIYLSEKGLPAPRASLERLWALLRNRRDGRNPILHPLLWHVLFLLREGIATEDELIWFLVGPRPFDNHYRRSTFSSLEMATAPPGSYGSSGNFPAAQRAVRKIADRIVDLELSRGEEPEVWSHAAVQINTLYGARHLQRLLVALDKTPLRRPASRSSDPQLTRIAVLIHLVHVCRPDVDDTPESFSEWMRSARIPTKRLLEVAMMRPAWTPFIAHATGIMGLRDAIGWIYAHTRSSDYQWESKSKEIWEGELGFDSAISAEEFIEGSVDAEWFSRAHAAVGADVWEILHGAAKFASTNNGHTRAQLFSDALLGKIKVEELEKQLFTKGDLNAARAIGLPPLPADGNMRRTELLRRYGILQQLRLTARTSKAQRRASEIAAFETGVRNLARQAGFEDTVRFEWAMECEAVADLSETSLQTEIDGVRCKIAIHPDGTLSIEATRNGKPLASVPATLKKHETFKPFKERMDELKAQASRLRPNLESLMVRAVVLPVSEWKKILAHPLAGPLLRRLVLADAKGPLGFPSEPGLQGVNECAHKWPDECTGLHLAHPTELLPAESWHAWQRFVFTEQIVQPFKQVFREIYLPAGTETTSPYASSSRFAGHELLSHQALAILSQRGWIHHPEDGLYRMFRNENRCAWLSVEQDWEKGRMTLDELRFTCSGRLARTVTSDQVPLRVFSETMRDIDLAVSVAHADGAAPEPGISTIEMRADLIRETCSMLEMPQVEIDGRYARITGKLGNYRVHLGSGIAHRDPGTMIPLRTDVQSERGRIFLPFADDDPQSIGILSRILLLAKDDTIRDPALSRALRESV